MTQNMRISGIMGLLILILFSCKPEKVQSEKSVAQKDTAISISFSPPTLSGPYYRELFNYQQDIILNPNNRGKKQKFIAKAYFTENNTLISFGCARKINPATNKPIARALIKRAALLDAKRWATYGLLWIKNDFQPDFGNMTEINSGQAQEVYSFDSGDSLVIAVASKVH